MEAWEESGSAPVVPCVVESMGLFAEQTLSLAVDALVAIIQILSSPPPLMQEQQQQQARVGNTCARNEDGGSSGSARSGEQQLLVDSVRPYSKFVLLTSLHFCCCSDGGLRRFASVRKEGCKSSTSPADGLVDPALIADKFFSKDERRRLIVRKTIIDVLVRRGEISDDSAEEAALLDSAMAAQPGRLHVVDASLFPLLVRYVPSLASPDDVMKDGSSSSPPWTFSCCGHMWMREMLPLLALSMTLESVALVARRAMLLGHTFRQWRRYNQTARQARTRPPASTVPSGHDQDLIGAAATCSTSLIRAPANALVPVSSRPAVNFLGPGLETSLLVRDGPTQTVESMRKQVNNDHQAVAVSKYFQQWKRLLDPFFREALRIRDEFIATRTEALRRRRNKLRLIRAKNCVLLRTAFELWRDVFVFHEKHLRIIAQNRERACKKKVLGQWCRALQLSYASRLHDDITKRQVMDQMKLCLFARRQDCIQTRQFFGVWRRMALLKSFFHTAKRKLFSLWRQAMIFQRHSRADRSIRPQIGSARALFHAFLTWKEKYLARKLQQIQLAGALNRWVINYERRMNSKRLCSEADMHCAIRCKQAAWRTWQVRLVHRRAAHSNGPGASSPVQLAKKHVARKFWLIWLRRFCARNELKSRLAMMTDLWGGRWLARSFSWWARHAELKRCGRKAAVLYRFSRLGHVFRQWRQRSRTTSQLREWREHKADGRYRERLARFVMRRWTERLLQSHVRVRILSEEVDLQVAVNMHNAAVKRKCFFHWAGAFFAGRVIRRQRLRPAVDISGNSRLLPGQHQGASSIRGRFAGQGQRAINEAFVNGDSGADAGLNRSAVLRHHRVYDAASDHVAPISEEDEEEVLPDTTCTKLFDEHEERVVVHVPTGGSRLTPKEVERRLFARLLEQQHHHLHSAHGNPIKEEDANTSQASVEVVEMAAT